VYLVYLLKRPGLVPGLPHTCETWGDATGRIYSSMLPGARPVHVWSEGAPAHRSPPPGMADRAGSARSAW